MTKKQGGLLKPTRIHGEFLETNSPVLRDDIGKVENE